MTRHFPLVPNSRQISAYLTQGYVVASPRFSLRHQQHQRWCEMIGKPLVVIWPSGFRLRDVTMQLFKCSDSILDSQFRTDLKNLAEIWGARAFDAEKLPIRLSGLTPRHARTLAGYFHGLALGAFQRRAQRIKEVLVISDPASRALPTACTSPSGALYGTCVGSDSMDHHCVVALDNGERFKIGFRGPLAPSAEYVRQQFADNPCAFSPLPSVAAE